MRIKFPQRLLRNPGSANEMQDSKGRQTYELIPTAGTKILWPIKRDVGISQDRML